MIHSLSELFPSSPISNVEFPAHLLRGTEDQGGNRLGKIPLAQFFPGLDVTFYPPLSRTLNEEALRVLNRAGLDRKDIEMYRTAHDGSHSFLENTGVGVQQLMLEDRQVEIFAYAMKPASESLTDESIGILRMAREDIRTLKKIAELIFSRSEELNEAFAGFCSIISTDERKKEVVENIVEADLKKRDSDLAKRGGQGRFLQLWKEISWIYRQFGIDTVVDCVEFALNIPVFASEYINRYGNFFAGINPKARFDIVRRVLEKGGIKEKEEIAEEANKSSSEIRGRVSRLEGERILRILVGDQEVVLVGPSYLAVRNFKGELLFKLPLSYTRPSSIIIEEALPGYWKEAMKGETKRAIRHPLEGDLTLIMREDVGYTRRISGSLETAFLFSVLKDQALDGEVPCLKRGFRRCQTKHLGRREKGWDKFGELKCPECPDYEAVKIARKIGQVWSAS